jgi:hypothetical protein
MSLHEPVRPPRGPSVPGRQRLFYWNLVHRTYRHLARA